MENVTNILELIEKYGTTSFVMVIAILALYYISKYFVKKFDALEQRNNELIEKILDKTKEKEHNIENDILRSQNINENIFEIKNITKAKSVKLSTFHNGLRSFNNIPFLKFSTTHRTNHNPYDISILNTPISLNYIWYSLLSDKTLNYYNTNIKTEDKYIVSSLNSRCCQQIISIKLYNCDCQIVGIVDIEYDEITEFIYENVKDIVLKLGFLV